jgi:uncharacterized damage-inducible protein DinB
VTTTLDLVHAFCDYNQWADERVLEAAARLNSDNFAKDSGASFGSIEANLAHIVAAQVIWLSRWKTGVNPRSVEDEGDMHGYDTIRSAFDASHADLAAFVAALTDERLGDVLHFTNSRGETHDRPLWQLMVHVVNHGTHHRAETAMALTALGTEPRPLDYSYFEFDRA